jgi:hypothetical protein
VRPDWKHATLCLWTPSKWRPRFACISDWAGTAFHSGEPCVTTIETYWSQR